MESNSANTKYLIVIGGPTAVGKTSVSIAVAQALSCDIISADSRQGYREMSIGTAKPSQEELNAVTHHLISHISIHDSYTVGDYEREALSLLQDEIFQSQNIALLTGGTGLYIKAVCEGLNQFPEVDKTVQQQIVAELESQGIARLQEELKIKDPSYFAEADISNPHRLIRALSVIRTTGNTFSEYLKAPKTPRAFIPIYISLSLPREELYQRINKRVDLMIEQGLIEEARGLYKFQHLRSLQTVGYQELFAHFNGEYSESEAISKIKQHSRNYAKRQMTWFRNQGNWHKATPADIEAIISWIKNQIN